MPMPGPNCCCIPPCSGRVRFQIFKCPLETKSGDSVTVTDGTTTWTLTTDSSGIVYVDLLVTGTYTATATVTGYPTKTASITVTSICEHDLVPITLYGKACVDQNIRASILGCAGGCIITGYTVTVTGTGGLSSGYTPTGTPVLDFYGQPTQYMDFPIPANKVGPYTVVCSHADYPSLTIYIDVPADFYTGTGVFAPSPAPLYSSSYSSTGLYPEVDFDLAYGTVVASFGSWLTVTSTGSYGKWCLANACKAAPANINITFIGDSSLGPLGSSYSLALDFAWGPPTSYGLSYTSTCNKIYDDGTTQVWCVYNVVVTGVTSCENVGQLKRYLWTVPPPTMFSSATCDYPSHFADTRFLFAPTTVASWTPGSIDLYTNSGYTFGAHITD